MATILLIEGLFAICADSQAISPLSVQIKITRIKDLRITKNLKSSHVLFVENRAISLQIALKKRKMGNPK